MTNQDFLTALIKRNNQRVEERLQEVYAVIKGIEEVIATLHQPEDNLQVAAGVQR